MIPWMFSWKWFASSIYVRAPPMVTQNDVKLRQVITTTSCRCCWRLPIFSTFSVRNTRGIDEWHSHMGFPVENLSIKHRVNPMDGMVLAWYPLASEIDPWHAPVLTKVGNPKRLSWKQPKCTISIYNYDKFQKDQHLFRGPITAFFQKNWFPKAWKSTDYGWLCHVGCHLWG